MNVHEFAQQIVNGLSLGAIFALIAVGYTMVYGVLRLINFAHGEIYMIGAMSALYAGTFWFRGSVQSYELWVWFSLSLSVVAVFATMVVITLLESWSKPDSRALRSIVLLASVLALIGTIVALHDLWDTKFEPFCYGLAVIAWISFQSFRNFRAGSVQPGKIRSTIVYGGSVLVGLGFCLAMRMWFRPPQNTWWLFLGVLLAAMVSASLLGFTIELVAYRPLRNQPRINALITAIGISMFLQFGGQSPRVFGASPKAFPNDLVLPKMLPGTFEQPTQLGQMGNVKFKSMGSVIKVGPDIGADNIDRTVTISAIDILILLVTIGLMVALRYIVMHTKTGLALRAVSFRFDTAALMGVNINRIISFTFILGSALAAAAGVLVASGKPKVDPLMGLLPGLKAFVAAVLGGIGNITGAVVGGILLGLIETFVAAYLPYGSQCREGIAFVILVIVLLVKPSGLFGSNVAEKV